MNQISQGLESQITTNFGISKVSRVHSLFKVPMAAVLYFSTSKLPWSKFYKSTLSNESIKYGSVSTVEIELIYKYIRTTPLD